MMNMHFLLTIRITLLHLLASKGDFASFPGHVGRHLPLSIPAQFPAADDLEGRHSRLLVPSMPPLVLHVRRTTGIVQISRVVMLPILTVVMLLGVLPRAGHQLLVVILRKLMMLVL